MIELLTQVSELLTHMSDFLIFLSKEFGIVIKIF